MSVSSSCPADTVTNRLTPYTTEVGLTLGTYIHVVLTFSRLAIGKDFGQRFFQNNVKVIVAILICHLCLWEVAFKRPSHGSSNSAVCTPVYCHIIMSH